MELLPIMHPGQEKFGEKSFSNWIGGFKPDLVFTHLDIQMFGYMIQAKKPDGIQMPCKNEEGEVFTNSQFSRLAKKAFKESQKDQFKLASIIPMDGQPSVPQWYDIIKHVDYPIAMSRYGQSVLADDFNGYKSTYIPHGVDCDFFKPKMINHPDPDAFIVGMFFLC